MASAVTGIIMPKTGKYPSQMSDDEIDAYVRSSLEVRLSFLFSF